MQELHAPEWTLSLWMILCTVLMIGIGYLIYRFLKKRI